MRNIIREYLEFSEEEKRTIWQNAVFVFDTNILLNLYRYTESTRKNLLDSIKKIKDRIWIPYQVAYEFMKDRPDIIFETERRYEDLIKQGDQFIRNLSNDLRIPSDDASLNELHEKIKTWIGDRKRNDLSVTHPSKDGLLDEILDLFEGKVGEKPSKDAYDKIVNEGNERYKKKIPPGFKDIEKSKRGDNSEFGDLLVWKEIIAYSKDCKKDIIYVTNDKKEDWWEIHYGKTLGPRIELKKEFSEETQKNFLLYSMDSFIEYMNKDGASISKEAIDEIKTTAPAPSPNILCQINSVTTNSANSKILLNIEDRIVFLNELICKKQSMVEKLKNVYRRTKNFNLYTQILNTQLKIEKMRGELYELSFKRKNLLQTI